MSDASPNIPSKPELRRTMREALRSIPAEEVRSRSKSLLQHLMRDDRWPGYGGTVALFGGLPGEPDLLPLLSWLQGKGARAVFFAVSGHDLTPYVVRSPEDLRRGTLDVWEPVTDPTRLVSPSELTAILTPALAFGQSNGTRIGRGAGYYDRFFAMPGVKAARIGIAFDLQIIPHIPTEAHDARVESFVTESGWIRF